MFKRLNIAIITIYLILLTSCGTSGTTELGSLKMAADITFDENSYQHITIPQNELGFKLLQHIEPDEDQNKFISPTSLFMALAMLYNGADGETKKEIAATLQTEGITVNDLNEANASLMSMLHKETDDITLRIANSIWLNENFHFQTDFAKHTTDYFNAEIEEIDVLDAQSPKLINDWVDEATNGKIEDIVDSLNANTVALVINAIYLHAGWTIPFDEKRTEDKPFHLENGSTITTPLMTLKEKLPYLENEHFQAVQLTYGDDKNMSMTIMLPHEHTTMSDFEQMISYNNWDNWTSEFNEQEGTLLLPRFQIEYETILNESLEALGMPSAFNEEADFSKMVEEDVHLAISKVKQKTFVDVNEEGTEAAAATSIGIEMTSAPIDEQPFLMEVDRPFFVAITDHETNAILFMGSIHHPTNEND